MKRLQKISMMVLALWLTVLIVGCAPVDTGTQPSVEEAPTASADLPATAEEDPFRVALLTPSAVNDLAFSQSMYDALLRIQDEMGGPEKMTFVYSQGMFIIDDAAVAIRTYAAQGYDLVIAHGSQYGSSLQEIAPEFPGTSFIWGTSAETFGLPNVFAYEAAAQEGGFINGVLAASLTSSKRIGVIGPLEVGDAKLYVDGFKAGVLATDPEIQVDVNYIGTFSDVVLASDAANEYIAAGADVLTGSAQMVVGPIGMADETNTLWFGTQSNQTSLAPKVVVANQVYHWEVVLRDVIAKVQAGTLGGETFTINLENGGLVIEYNPDFSLPANVKSLSLQTVQGVADGSIAITLP